MCPCVWVRAGEKDDELIRKEGECELPSAKRIISVLFFLFVVCAFLNDNAFGNWQSEFFDNYGYSPPPHHFFFLFALSLTAVTILLIVLMMLIQFVIAWKLSFSTFNIKQTLDTSSILPFVVSFFSLRWFRKLCESLLIAFTCRLRLENFLFLIFSLPRFTHDLTLCDFNNVGVNGGGGTLWFGS